MKTWRFFYHYNKVKSCLTIHFRGECHMVNEISCGVPCESKWNNRQPKLVMRGKCHHIMLSKTISGRIRGIIT